MRFFSLIDRKSAIYRDWREHNRLGGFIDGVEYKLINRNYLSEELTDDQISKILARQDKAILLQVVHVLPDKKPKPEPEKPPEKIVESRTEPRVLPVVEKPIEKRTRMRLA